MSSEVGVQVLIPRPESHVASAKTTVITGPSQALYAESFAAILPDVRYLVTDVGRIAYYQIEPVNDTNDSKGAPIDLSVVPERILLLHGVQTPALGLMPLARALHSEYPHADIVVPDLWGHGLSDTPLMPHVPELFHQLIDALLYSLRWSSTHLIGFSFGGATAAGYTAERSDRVRSLVLIAPAGLMRLENFTAEERIHLGRDCVDEVAAENWIREFLEGGELVVPSDWKARVAAGQLVPEALRDWQNKHHRGHRASVTAMFRDGGALDRHEIFARAAAIDIPAVAILGALDDICGEDDLKACGFSRVFTVPDAGHGVVRDKVKKVAEIIVDFWKQDRKE